MTPAALARGARRLRVALHPSPAAVALRRSRADAGLLAVTAVLLAVAAALAVVVPAGLAAAADRAVVAAAASDPARAAVVVEVPLGDASERSVTAGVLVSASQAQADAVGRSVPGVLGRPVGSLEVERLSTLLAVGEQGLTSLRLVHPWRSGVAGSPAVTWTSGGAAGTPDLPGTDGEPVVLAVGLAEPVARALGVGPGDPVPAVLGGPGGAALDVVVSGTFVPVDAADPAWAAAPGLLAPQVSGSGRTAATDVAALVDDAQVPALVALPAVRPVVTTTLPVLASALDADGAETTARSLAALEAAPPAQLPGVAGAPARLRTDLDDVLRAAGAEVASARARASMLLSVLLGGTAAVVVLAASLLASRRGAVLAVLRTRGTPLLATAAETAVEALVLVAAAVGLAAGLAAGLAGLSAAGGLGAVRGTADPPALVALLALLLLAVAAPVLFAVGRARSVDDRARGTRRPDRRGGALALDGALVLLAALAVAALTTAPTPTTAAGPLTSAALPLGGLAAARVGRRLLLPVLAPVRSRATHRGGAVGLIAAARLERAARRTPELVALVLTTAGAAAAVLLAAAPSGLAGPVEGAAAGVLAGELRRLAVVVAVVLSLLGALAVVLDAVGTAPERRTEASAAAVLGLSRLSRRAVAVGELGPLAVAGVLLGAAAGAGLALAVARALGHGA